MNKKLGLGALLLALLALLFPGSPVQIAQLGGSPANLPSDVATSSTVEVGNDSVDVLFPATPGSRLCASRTVGTVADAILIRFNAGAVASSSLYNGLGFPQAASTTVTYAAEDVGCGAWVVTSLGAGGSSTISVSENKQ